MLGAQVETKDKVFLQDWKSQKEPAYTSLRYFLAAPVRDIRVHCSLRRLSWATPLRCTPQAWEQLPRVNVGAHEVSPVKASIQSY